MLTCLAVCPTHKKYVQRLVDLMVEEELGDGNGGGRVAALPVDDNSQIMDQVIQSFFGNHLRLQEPADEEERFDEFDPNLVSAFRSFASAAGESRLTGSTSFGELKRRTQQKKVCSARRLLDVACQITAKSDWKEFRSQVVSSNAIDVYSARKSSHKVKHIVLHFSHFSISVC